ncbi:hypothetical protein VKT23_010150 [Stygiomarasmius scandens]|uniref:Cytochrome P450 n=1 Tax=Marasmiellus scandens TaxID=2682957 RepID=A0ABR1JHF5_9AGAR
MLANVYPFSGWIGHYFDNFSMYNRYKSACVSSVLITDSRPIFWLADAQAIKATATDKTAFDKDIDVFENGVNFFGPNIVATQDRAWKRHRFVANPAFNESIYRVVWQETTHALTDWFSEVDSKSQSNHEISIHTAQSFTKLALLTFLRAGFGELDTPQNDLYTVLKDTFHYSAARAIIPDWLFSLTNRIYIPFISAYLRKTLKAYNDLETIAMHAVSRARADLLQDVDQKAPKGGALLRNLVEANMHIDEGNRSENDKRSLTDRELLSNIFVCPRPPVAPTLLMNPDVR